jgi:hypothetical protein
MRDLELMIADINGLDPIPDVIVHTGDIVHNGDPQEYALATGHSCENATSRLCPGGQ